MLYNEKYSDCEWKTQDIQFITLDEFGASQNADSKSDGIQFCGLQDAILNYESL